jgi:hypothetical protein
MFCPQTVQQPRKLSAVRSIFEHMNERRVTSEEWIAHQRAMQETLGSIAALEDKIAACQAEQVRLTATYVDARVTFDDEHGFLSGPAQYRGMVAEIAIAKRVSVTAAATFMDDAWHLAKHLPQTTTALAEGRIGLTAARAIAHETMVIDDPQTQALADELLADEAADLLPGKVRPMAEQRVAEIDPDAALRRAVRERADRHLQLSPAGSGMSWLSAYLPAEHAAAAYNAIQDHATALRAAGDPRTTNHLMCDTMFERLTGIDTDAIPSQINVVMTDATLLGLSDDPAHLVGGGPLAAPHARELATNGKAWLRRFLTDPVDGSLTHGDPRRRRFDGSLRALVIARDQHCQGIQCARRIRDIDHVTPHAEGGTTTLDDGQGMDRACHTSRDDPRMQVRRHASTGVTTWTTPSGLTWRALPPRNPVAGPSLSEQHHWRRHLLQPPDSIHEQSLVEVLVVDLKHRPRRC